MSELLTELVPGLPQELREDILIRAEGVPLYAVETVRMLLTGLLVRRKIYQLTDRRDARGAGDLAHSIAAVSTA
jgi:hypothetical protein